MSRVRAMVSLLLLRLCLLSLTHAAAADGLQSPDYLMMFALEGDDVTLPCGIPSTDFCSSINWSMSESHGLFAEVAKSGVVTTPNNVRLRVLNDCSLKINHLVLKDALLYSCDNGALNSTVWLQILQLAESSSPADNIIELECFLSTHIGLSSCDNRGIHIKWTTQDNTPLNGNRFSVETHSDCFSKLKFTKKPTDHHRKWKCHLFQNDTVKATISYTTTVGDGEEEVFATVGESVSLSCGNTSSLGASGDAVWSTGGRTLTDISTQNGQTEAFHVNAALSLVISKVSTLHAGNYQCSESAVEKNVFNKVRLHTLDVTSDSGPGEENVTLTCVLTCAEKCEKDYSLTWSGSSQNSSESSLKSVNNTLIKRLFLPVLSKRADELTCSVRREGEVMASKRWRTVNSLHTLAWLALPLGLLIAAVGLYVYMKRKHNKDTGNEESGIGMSHVYEVVRDADNEEPHQRLAATTTGSFYDLLQAVN